MEVYLPHKGSIRCGKKGGLAASMPTETTKKVRVDGVTTTISGTGE